MGTQRKTGGRSWPQAIAVGDFCSAAPVRVWPLCRTASMAFRRMWPPRRAVAIASTSITPAGSADPDPLGQKLPIIVYLHGGGERGTDGVMATQVGLGPAVQATLGFFSFLVVFPQCDPQSFWALPRWPSAPWTPSRSRCASTTAIPIASTSPATRWAALAPTTWRRATPDASRRWPRSGGVKPPRGCPAQRGRTA